MTPHIYLDLDDVLNTMVPALLHGIGGPIQPHDYERLVVLAGDHSPWMIVDIARSLFPERSYTWSTFWEAISEDIWASMPVSDMGLWLLELCATLVGRDNVSILTAPIRATGRSREQCLVGKSRWLEKELPEWAHHQYGLAPNKHFYASPRGLLIDDSEKNVIAWQAAGGSALLWPRPWNGLPPATTMDINARLRQWVHHATTDSTQLQRV
jgi:hypothetical protein